MTIRYVFPEKFEWHFLCDGLSIRGFPADYADHGQLPEMHATMPIDGSSHPRLPTREEIDVT